MMVVVDQNNNQVASDGLMGQPRLPYSDHCSKKATDLAKINENSTSLLVHAASILAKKEKMGDTAFVLKQTIHGFIGSFTSRP